MLHTYLHCTANKTTLSATFLAEHVRWIFLAFSYRSPFLALFVIILALAFLVVCFSDLFGAPSPSSSVSPSSTASFGSVTASFRLQYHVSFDFFFINRVLVHFICFTCAICLRMLAIRTRRRHILQSHSLIHFRLRDIDTILGIEICLVRDKQATGNGQEQQDESRLMQSRRRHGHFCVM